MKATKLTPPTTWALKRRSRFSWGGRAMSDPPDRTESSAAGRSAPIAMGSLDFEREGQSKPGSKRPMNDEQQSSTLTRFYKSARRDLYVPPQQMGLGLSLSVKQWPGGITDVTGHTTECREMLLKPLGFKWVKTREVWRYEGSEDPTAELVRRAKRDGVSISVDDRARAPTRRVSAAALMAQLSARAGGGGGEGGRGVGGSTVSGSSNGGCNACTHTRDARALMDDSLPSDEALLALCDTPGAAAAFGVPCQPAAPPQVPLQVAGGHGIAGGEGVRFVQPPTLAVSQQPAVGQAGAYSASEKPAYSECDVSDEALAAALDDFECRQQQGAGNL